TLAVGDNAVLRVELDGTSAGAANGLTLTGGGSTVRGLAINRFGGEGVEVGGAGNVLAGNFIGTDPGGATGLGNDSVGVRLLAATGSTVGGTTPDARNLISGNSGNGITISGGSGDVVAGNYVGTNAAGTTALANGGTTGILVLGSANAL